MKILHVFPKSNFIVSESFIRFVNDYFNSEIHDFAFVCSSNEIPKEIKKFKNINFIQYKQLIDREEQYDSIILHSIFQISTKVKSKLLLYPTLMNKIIWVSWGADLYQYKSNAKSIKSVIKNIVSTLFIKRIRNFVGIFPPDIEFFKKEFNSSARTFYASYVGNLYNPIYHKEISLEILRTKISDGECINIQIGHSSTRILNHIDVFESLYKFKDENIKIHIPLSYGDEKYCNEVEKKAKYLFGDKVVIIHDFMPIAQYMDYLSTMDIAIFNTSRQIGLGNINPLLYMGKKIYMPSGSVMFDYYRSIGINICDYNKIKNMNYLDFIKPLSMYKTRECIVNIFNNKYKKIEMWEKVFNLRLK